jgi:quinol monooxygenase YgiN
MAKLTIIATIVAKPGCETHVQQVLLDLIPLTRAEAGCIAYDLHQDLDKPGVFVFVETWENRELHAIHMQSPHLTAFPGRVDGEVESWDVKSMAVIGSF